MAINSKSLNGLAILTYNKRLRKISTLWHQSNKASRIKRERKNARKNEEKRKKRKHLPLT